MPGHPAGNVALTDISKGMAVRDLKACELIADFTPLPKTSCGPVGSVELDVYCAAEIPHPDLGDLGVLAVRPAS
jgi:hypothetical protein